MRFPLVFLVASYILTCSGYRVHRVSVNVQRPPLLNLIRLDAQKSDGEIDRDASSAVQTSQSDNARQIADQGAGKRELGPSEAVNSDELAVSSQLAGSAMFGLLGSLLLTHDAYPVLISAASTAIASKQKGILSDYLRDVGSSTYNLIAELYGMLSKEKAVTASGSASHGDQHQHQQQALPSLELLLASTQNTDNIEERIKTYRALESFLKEEKLRIQAAIEADQLRAAQLFQQRTSFLSGLTANLNQVDNEIAPLAVSYHNENGPKVIESENVKEEKLQVGELQTQLPIEEQQPPIQLLEQRHTMEKRSELGAEQLQQDRRSNQPRKMEPDAFTQKNEVQQSQQVYLGEADGSPGIASISDFQLILADHERLSGKDVTLEDRFEALSVLVSHMSRTVATELMNNLTVAYTNLKKMEDMIETKGDTNVSGRHLASVAPESTLHAVPNITILVRDPAQIDSGVQPHRDDHIVQPAPPARNIREALHRGTTPEYVAIYDRMYRGIQARHSHASEKTEEQNNEEQVKSATNEGQNDMTLSPTTQATQATQADAWKRTPQMSTVRRSSIAPPEVITRISHKKEMPLLSSRPETNKWSPTFATLPATSTKRFDLGTQPNSTPSSPDRPERFTQPAAETSTSTRQSADAIPSTRGMPIPAGSLVGRGYLSQDPRQRIEEIIKVHNQAVKRSRAQQQGPPQMPERENDQQSMISPFPPPIPESENINNIDESNKLPSESMVAINTVSNDNSLTSSPSVPSVRAQSKAQSKPDSDTFERLQQRQAMDWWQVRDAGSDLYASMQRRVSQRRLGEGNVRASADAKKKKTSIERKMDGQPTQQHLSAYESLHHAKMVSAAQTLLVEQQPQREEDEGLEVVKEASSGLKTDQQKQQRWVEEVLRRAHSPQTFLQHDVNAGLRADSLASRMDQ